MALLDAANDRNPVVQEQVRKSILTLGNQQPDKVLSMCQDYLLKHPKVSLETSTCFEKRFVCAVLLCSLLLNVMDFILAFMI